MTKPEAVRAAAGIPEATSSRRSSSWPPLLILGLCGRCPGPGTRATHEVSTPAASSCRSSSPPASSQPTTPTRRTFAPSAARFTAVFAAPPGAKLRRPMSTTGAGASRQSLSMVPLHQPSSIAIADDGDGGADLGKPAGKPLCPGRAAQPDGFPAIRNVLHSPHMGLLPVGSSGRPAASTGMTHGLFAGPPYDRFTYPREGSFYTPSLRPDPVRLPGNPKRGDSHRHHRELGCGSGRPRARWPVAGRGECSGRGVSAGTDTGRTGWRESESGRSENAGGPPSGDEWDRCWRSSGRFHGSRCCAVAAWGTCCLHCLPSLRSGQAYPDASSPCWAPRCIHQDLPGAVRARDSRPHPAVHGGRPPGPEDPAVLRPSFLRCNEKDSIWRCSCTAGGVFPIRSCFAWAHGIPSGPGPLTLRRLERNLPYAYYQHEPLRALEVAGLAGAPPVGLEAAAGAPGALRRAGGTLVGGGSRRRGHPPRGNGSAPPLACA